MKKPILIFIPLYLICIGITNASSQVISTPDSLKHTLNNLSSIGSKLKNTFSFLPVISDSIVPEREDSIIISPLKNSIHLHSLQNHLLPDNFKNELYLSKPTHSFHIIALPDNSYLSVKAKILNRFRSISPHFPAIPIRVTGTMSLETDYRSFLDTPIIQHEYFQHDVAVNVGLIIGSIPLMGQLILQKTNNPFLEDYHQLSFQFDLNAYKEIIKNKLKMHLLSNYSHAKDSLLNTAFQQKTMMQNVLQKWLNDGKQIQKLVDSKNQLKDIAKRKIKSGADSILMKKLKAVSTNMNPKKEELKQLENKLTTLSGKVNELKKDETNNLQHELSDIKSLNSASAIQEKVQKLGIYPGKYWNKLLSLRQFAVGKNNINYSDLTVQNISLTGVNIEYNPSYYIAFASGAVDYKMPNFFNDYYKNSPKQHLSIGRFGIGQKEKNYFIFSVYGGIKQSTDPFDYINIGTSNDLINPIKILGTSIESKIKLDKDNYFTIEVAHSISDSLRSSRSPKQLNKTFDINDPQRLAFTFKANGLINEIETRYNGYIEYKGAHFESFNTYNLNNNSFKWGLTIDQNLIQNKIHLNAYFKNEDLISPYFTDSFKNKLVLVGISSSLRFRKLPIITLGFNPTSQLSYFGNHWTVARFYVLNFAASQFYRVHQIAMNSSVMYNNFVSNISGASYIKNNVTVIFTHNIILNKISTFTSLNYNQNSIYKSYQLDQNISFPIKGIAFMTSGLKLNKLIGNDLRVGCYINSTINIKWLGSISIMAAKEYMPISEKGFYTDYTGSIQFTKAFGNSDKYK